MSEILDSIECQRCGPGSDGCETCGGYREVLVKVQDDEGRKYWVRPGVRSSYKGKVWYSFDGCRLEDA